MNSYKQLVSIVCALMIVIISAVYIWHAGYFKNNDSRLSQNLSNTVDLHADGFVSAKSTGSPRDMQPNLCTSAWVLLSQTPSSTDSYFYSIDNSGNVWWSKTLYAERMLLPNGKDSFYVLNSIGCNTDFDAGIGKSSNTVFWYGDPLPGALAQTFSPAMLSVGRYSTTTYTDALSIFRYSDDISPTGVKLGTYALKRAGATKH